MNLAFLVAGCVIVENKYKFWSACVYSLNMFADLILFAVNKILVKDQQYQRTLFQIWKCRPILLLSLDAIAVNQKSF